VSNWISVKDRLPENNKPIVVYLKDKELYIAAYGYFEFMDEDGECSDCAEDGMVQRCGFHHERESEGEYDFLIFDINAYVTHWMPLPESPGKIKFNAAPDEPTFNGKILIDVLKSREL